MSEPIITIDGIQLTTTQVRTISVALQSFGSDLLKNGLGEDEAGKEITSNYLNRIKEINDMFVAYWNKATSAWTPGEHQGLATDRLEENPLEAKFAKEWLEIQRAHLLDYLLSDTNNWKDATTTSRDEVVAATVIQWLGSPVGQGFLRDVLGVEIPECKGA